MAMLPVSRTALATGLPMRMAIRPGFRKAEPMKKFSSFDVATRSAMASAKFFSFLEWAMAIPLRRTGLAFSFSVKVLPTAPAIPFHAESTKLWESALAWATSFSPRLRFSFCAASASVSAWKRFS